MKPQSSLKARALQLLAQREQSRVELRRKLMPHAVAECGAEEVAVASGLDGASTPAEAASPAQRVESLLDWLEVHEYLSQERFVESRVHARASRFGNLRIRSELKQHAVALSPEVAHSLRDSELERARHVCARKFDAAPLSPAERARQSRFLAGRGFSPETIRRVLRGVPPPEEAEGD